MAATDWHYSSDYKQATPAERLILDELSDILYRVQYAKPGYKTEARRQASLEILQSIKDAYLIHKGGNR